MLHRGDDNSINGTVRQRAVSEIDMCSCLGKRCKTIVSAEYPGFSTALSIHAWGPEKVNEDDCREHALGFLFPSH